MRRIGYVAVIVMMVLSGAVVLGVTSAAEARAAGPPRISGPDHARAGKAFVLVAHRGGATARRVLLERRSPGHAWRRAAVTSLAPRATTTSFRRVERRAGTVKYRVTIGHKTSAVHRVQVRRATPPKPVTVLLLTASAAGDGDTMVDDPYTVSGALTRDGVGISGVTITVQRRFGATGPWQAWGTHVTDGDGSFRFTDSSSEHGVVYYRATGGGHTGVTAIPVFKVVSMGDADGGTVAPDSDVKDCAATSEAAGVVRLTLRSTMTCTPIAGNWVEVGWTLPGVCSPIGFSGFSLTSESSPTATEVGLRVSLDQNAVGNDRLVGRGTTSPSFSTSSDEFSTITVRMTITKGSGDYVGQFSDFHATCA